MTQDGFTRTTCPPRAVNFVYVRVAHYGSYSGYDCIVHGLGKRVPGPMMRRWPAGRPASLLNTAVSMVTGSPWYTCAALLNEAAALAHMGATTGQIYHVLNGDTDLRFLPYFNGWRGHQVVTTFHQPPPLLEELTPHWAQYLRSAIAVGTGQVETLRQWLSADRIQFIPHPIDVSFFAPPRMKPPNGGSVLSVGIHLRDFDLIAEIAPLIHETTGAEWTVVAPHSAEAVKRARVQWLSNLTDSELLRVYQETSVCALPLKDATANNALLEAMACGLPIVVSDVGSIRDYVDESCAILVAPGDRSGFSRAVTDLLQDSARREQLGRAARRRASSFSVPDVQAQLRRYYADLAERSDCQR